MGRACFGAMMMIQTDICLVLSWTLTQPRRHLSLCLPSPASLASLAAALVLLV